MTMNLNSPVPTAEELHIYTPQQLAARNAEMGTSKYLIDGLLPATGLSILVGTHNEGKSPWIYQAAISIAAGVPAFGLPTASGVVLYLDAENRPGDVEKLVTTLSKHIGLPAPPENLRLWNLNDINSAYGSAPCQLDMYLAAIKPSLVVIDPYKAIFPDIASKAEATTAAYTHFRQLASKYQCQILGVHHPRKASTNPAWQISPLELVDDVREWMRESSGSAELLNGSDVRLGFDRAVSKNAEVVVRGFARLRGEIPTMFFTRDRDEDGDPIGYRRLTGRDALAPDIQALHDKLPNLFQRKELVQAYGKSDGAGSKALGKLLAAGVVRKAERGLYRKVSCGGKAGESEYQEAA